MHKIFLVTFLFFILFIVGIAVANNASIERPMDPYLSKIRDLFKTDSADSWLAPRPVRPLATKIVKPHVPGPTASNKSVPIRTRAPKKQYPVTTSYPIATLIPKGIPVRTAQPSAVPE